MDYLIAASTEEEQRIKNHHDRRDDSLDRGDGTDLLFFSDSKEQSYNYNKVEMEAKVEK